jgi:4-alpha-glucanotransferase
VSPASALDRLADRFGLLPGYVGTDGLYHETTDGARRAVLGVLGVDASDPEAALRAAPAAAGAVIAAPGARAWLDLSDGARPAHATLRLEDGTEQRVAVPRRGRRMRLPELPIGVHDIALGEGAPRPLIVAPPKCLSHREVLGERRCFGLWANLYSLRSERGLGIGDFSDLRALLRFAGGAGAAFVGINPLHAQRNRWHDVSPYCGLSRIYRNPLYLALESVPELAGCEAARARLEKSGARIAELRSSPRVAYERIAALQGEVLADLHDAFERGARDTARARAYRAFRDADGGLAVDYGTFLALADHFDREGRGVDWRRWPEEMRDPRSAAVRAFREAHRELVDRHVFVQFEIECQLAEVAEQARAHGLPLGVYQDLALGCAMSGFDAWAFPGLFLSGASLGAPPDPYAAQGQDWGIPPLDPRALAADGYRYWRLVLRAAMAHSGALRIDHVMGLLRQFWVPAGRGATEGCYVAYPLRELLAVLAILSRRHRCVVIGEDLGTVPHGFASTLARAGVLSSRVLLFERTRTGAFRASRRYSAHALVTANTHDHPTLPGWARERDLELLHEVGVLADEAALAAARRDRQRDLALLRRRLRAEGALHGRAPAPWPDLCAAVYAFLARCPAPLLGVSFDDLAGETEPVNIPGVPQDVYPSWTRRMARSVADVTSDANTQSIFAGLLERRRR